MATFWRDDRIVRDTQGRVVPNASVYWVAQPTTNTTSVPPAPLASIASNSSGSSTTNPQITDGFGHAAAYMTSGFYTVVFVWNGKIQQVFPDQSIGVNSSTGTVTSVGLTAPADLFTVNNSPVTTAGSISIAENTQVANVVWAGPASGSPATPTMRSLVKADFPTGVSTLNQIDLSKYVSSPRTGKFALHCGQITATQTSLVLGSSSYGLFSAGDVGKIVVVEGAGSAGTNLITTIAGFTNSTTVTLTAAAATTTSIAIVAWYSASQDDTAAFNTAQGNLLPGTGTLYAPGDVYVISSSLTADVNLSSLVGDGISNTLFLFTGTGSFLTFSNPVLGMTMGGSGRDGFTLMGPGTSPLGLITNVQLTTNVATFTQSNTYSAGQVVLVQGLTTTNGRLFNDLFYTVTGSTGTSWTGTGLTHADIASTPDTGGANLDYTAFKFTSAGMDFIEMANIEVHAFAGDGVQYTDGVVCRFSHTVFWNMGGNGFNLLNTTNITGGITSGSAGTASHFDTTWVKGAQKAAYYSNQLVYCSFSNTAADQCGVAYFFEDGLTIEMNGCGCESQTYRNAAYPGYSYLFDACSGIKQGVARAFTGSNTGNVASTPWVFRNNTKHVTIDHMAFDNGGTSPTLPTNLFTIDSTCSSIDIGDASFGSLATTAFSIDPSAVGVNFSRNGSARTPIVALAGTNTTGGVISDVVQISNGTAFAATNITTPLDSKWGSTASVSLASGKTGAFAFNISSAGTGQGANPSVVINITALGLSSNPQPQISNRGAATSWSLSVVSSTSMTFVYNGTPVAGSTYGATVFIVSQG